MYTSAINDTRKSTLKTSLIYLLAAAFCGVFGGVYEIFSHGVFSGFMVFAFTFPLILGALPFFLFYFAGNRQKPGILPASLWHSGVITLTTGSLMTGVLEIYGTTNRLICVYWILGAVLLFCGIVTYAVSCLNTSIKPGRKNSSSHNGAAAGRNGF